MCKNARTHARTHTRTHIDYDDPRRIHLVNSAAAAVAIVIIIYYRDHYYQYYYRFAIFIFVIPQRKSKRRSTRLSAHTVLPTPHGASVTQVFTNSARHKCDTGIYQLHTTQV